MIGLGIITITFPFAGFLIHLHTLETFGLEDFFPILNGLGLLGLLVTGIYMTRLFREKRPKAIDH